MRLPKLSLLVALALLQLQAGPTHGQVGFGNAGPEVGNGPANNAGGGNRGANPGDGGGQFADFESLMQLIETTVAPETWEALGGPSTMFPYPQGVYVDASGTLRDIQWPADDGSLDKLKSILVQPQDASGTARGDWKMPSARRFVSLRRLAAEKMQFASVNSEAIDCLAGLSEIRYVFLDRDDVIIAGSVGGIESVQGWYRDRKTGRTTLRSDFFVTCLAAALAGEPFGCTIDPTREGLQQAAQVANEIKHDTIPIDAAAEQLVSALGMQRIEVFGTAGDSPIGYVMVEADRHMKQLALGIHPMPRNAENYLDAIEQTIDQGPPQDLLLRLWFTAKPRAVRAGSDRTTFEIAGKPIRLSGQNERAMASGARGNIQHDPRTKIFVDGFNRHWDDIAQKYPIYGSLESIFHAASIAELLNRTCETAEHRELLRRFASIGSTSSYRMPTPRQVESIAVLHSFQRDRRKHHILIASGGVAVRPRQTLTASIAEYPTLNSTPQPTTSQPAMAERWWWDQ